MKYFKVLFSLSLAVWCLPSIVRAQTSSIALVQHTSKDAGAANSTTLPFNSNNTAGNWIGVCIRAGYSGQSFTVTDSNGNAYHRAAQFNLTVDTPNGNTLGIFYAENIAGGANTISVSDTISGTLRIAIVEYSGVATTNSLDVIAMAQGNGVSPNSGNAATSVGDLLLGAVSTANSANFTAGGGFSTVESVPRAPGTKLFVEQQIKTNAGTDSAQALVGASDNWGAVLAAFKGGAGVAAKPNITSLSPGSGTVGTMVTITGTNFGTAMGTVTFNGTAGTPTTWSATRIAVPVPSGATTGNVIVTDPGVPSNAMTFTVIPPDTTPPVVTITSPGNNATISGTATITASATDNVAVASVQFKVDNLNSGPAIVSGPYSRLLNTTALSNGNHILTAVATDTSGNATTSAPVTVNVNNAAPAPSITTLNPTSGPVGTSVTIAGTNYGATQGTSAVTFNGIAATPTGWSATSIVVPVPAGATSGNVVVTVGGVASNGVNFTVTIPAPSITSLNSTSGQVGTSITIAGTNFGATQGASTVTFNGTTATPTSWGTTSMVVPVPAGATTGSVAVTVGGVASNGVNFTVLSPAARITLVQRAGKDAGATTSSSVAFNTANSAGNFIAVCIRAGSSGQAFTVRDSNGNTYRQGVQFNVTADAPNGDTLGIFYAENINGGANTITVSDTILGTLRFSILEYSGIATGNSLDVTATGQGTSGSPNSANAVTTSNGELLLSAISTGNSASFTAGSGFAIEGSVPAEPNTKLIAEDRIQTAAGTVSAGAFLGAPDNWGVALAAFKAGSAGGGTAPSIASLNPNTGAVGTSVAISGANFGATQGTSTVTFNGTAGTPTSWSATSITVPVPAGATTGNVVVTVSGVASNGVSFTVPGGTSMGPLKQGTTNPHYFVDPSGKAILLTGSQTWDTFQDLDQSSSPAAFDFTAYVNFLKSHGQNVTILWRKDLPTYCSWGAGGTWHVAQFPWKRTGGASGTQVASDGLPAFDLTQLDQTYFDRLRARVIQLQQNGIYAVVELFDGLGLSNNRCSNDGYPFTGGNNVNGVDDGGGTNSMTMGSPNSITNYQDAYVQKVIDTVNDQANVLWEPSEEAPDNSTWWQGHMISLIHSYEAGKPQQHPVGYATLNVNGASDTTLYNSNADWVAPVARISPTSSCGSGTPACKVNINDSDHSYFGMWNDSAQVNRNYVWENFANGNQVMFMDPYLIYWTTGNRNLCQSPTNGVCTGPDARWNNMRDNLGYTLSYANKMDLAKMTPQGSLASTGYCLADNVATGAEYLVYAPNGGSFTVNLSATTRALNVEWFDPSSGATTSGGTISGGSTTTFTPPFGGDAVLYIVDAAGHN